tara:strand:+ start:43 stop:192 length:150 start_codon:yes stop_codon:yes gene_type:complete
MNSEFKEKIKRKIDSSESLKTSEDCKVSKASTAIMLDRFCNGKKIEFPF